MFMNTGSSWKRKYRVTSAYTLMEVLIAVAIIGTIFVSLYRGIAFCFDKTKSERENLRATQVILRRLEGIRLLSWDQLTNSTYNPGTFYETYLPGVAGSGVTYTGQIVVAGAALDPPASYGDRMKSVTVTVTWSSGPILHTRTAKTYVSRDGIQNYVYRN
jgi:prepilin-type N-terminal cleavage/methylation domain-containing protein